MNLSVHAKTDPRLLLMSNVSLVPRPFPGRSQVVPRPFPGRSQAVPRLFPPPVFDSLQYAKMEGGRPGNKARGQYVGWLLVSYSGHMEGEKSGMGTRLFGLHQFMFVLQL